MFVLVGSKYRWTHLCIQMDLCFKSRLYRIIFPRHLSALWFLKAPLCCLALLWPWYCEGSSSYVAPRLHILFIDKSDSGIWFPWFMGHVLTPASPHISDPTVYGSVYWLCPQRESLSTSVTVTASKTFYFTERCSDPTMEVHPTLEQFYDKLLTYLWAC